MLINQHSRRELSMRGFSLYIYIYTASVERERDSYALPVGFEKVKSNLWAFAIAPSPPCVGLTMASMMLHSWRDGGSKCFSASQKSILNSCAFVLNISHQSLCFCIFQFWSSLLWCHMLGVWFLGAIIVVWLTLTGQHLRVHLAVDWRQLIQNSRPNYILSSTNQRFWTLIENKIRQHWTTPDSTCTG